MLDKRTNVLLEKSDFIQLSQVAKEKNTTVSELIRYALRKTFELSGNDNRAQLLDEIKKLSKNIDLRGLNYKDLTHDGHTR